jgi:hypothetical protein
MVLKNSTYLDLVSTGNLSLIRVAALRDEIVDFSVAPAAAAEGGEK